MRIFDENKINEIQEKDIDFSRYKLREDKHFVKHHEAVQGVKEQCHYETLKVYPNGGKDVVKIVDVPGVEPKEAFDEYEDVLCLVPLTIEERIAYLRNLREEECFSVINRGKFWYNTLTSEQERELNNWYQCWLDVTKNGIIPTRPNWLK